MKFIPTYWLNKKLVKMNASSRSFTQKPWSQGVVLIAFVIVAMILANLPYTRHIYHNILETGLSINVTSPGGGTFSFPKEMTVEKFINDILMVVFFFTVGLEIKREIISGELSSTKKAIMPIIAAFGGVVAPALIFLAINKGTAAGSGWGIPTATDIAFAIGILAILGDKVPVSLKVFLTALAIADDLIAILVIAIFYGSSVKLILLGIAFLLVIGIIIMKKMGEKRPWFYFIPAIGVWTLFYYSGIHATMSGVVMAFLIPSRPRYSKNYLIQKNKIYTRKLLKHDDIDKDDFPNPIQRKVLRDISRTSNDSIAMSDRLEHVLGPWVNFLIMPIFALANAGVTIPGVEYFNIFHFTPEMGSVGMGIVFGLVFGKPIGITLTSWLAVKTKLGAMPARATWPMLLAVACLGGIGFTMSIFVDTLSFADAPEYTQQLRDMGKVAVLMGSLVAAILGCVLVNMVHKKKTAQRLN
ncbi:MAG: Na+/H+ antiporter NhaA [Bacteroidales bacterium]|nr:Na+/H+ antiporter NhaA [Bacteroidales bacterium]MBP5517812.1 Na+/H+ antiporter NhaA [Bacteroidales bacterium]